MQIIKSSSKKFQKLFHRFARRDRRIEEKVRRILDDVKNNGVARSIVNGPRDLHRVVVGRLRFLQKTPERIRSFFQAPETRYAA